MEAPGGGGGGGGGASQLPDGLAHGAGVVGEALDVLERHVDDAVAAGVAVQVSAGEALQARLVADAALAVRPLGAQRQRAGQGAALRAAGRAAALLGGRPGAEETAGDTHETHDSWGPSDPVLGPSDPALGPRPCFLHPASGSASCLS